MILLIKANNKTGMHLVSIQITHKYMSLGDIDLFRYMAFWKYVQNFCPAIGWIAKQCVGFNIHTLGYYFMWYRIFGPYVSDH